MDKWDRREMYKRISLMSGAVVLAVSAFVMAQGCAGLGQPMSADQAAQLQAGAAYLDASVAKVQAAVENARSLDHVDPAKLKPIEDALATVKTGSAALASSTSTAKAEDKWSWARTALDTALTIAAPLLINALAQ